jgi:hypothetical protein
MHTKVYYFTHQFLIPSLEELALQHLTQVLLMCETPSNSFVLHITDAVRLVYESTPNTTQSDDPAQQLLSQYVALNYTATPTENLAPLISEGCEFMIDVAHKLARQIVTSGRNAQCLEEHIDELKIKVNGVEKELQEWENWN